jgi:hypothetical protein
VIAVTIRPRSHPTTPLVTEEQPAGADADDRKPTKGLNSSALRREPPFGAVPMATAKVLKC